MPEPTKEIKSLVTNLGDPSYQEREKADQELRKIGWKALKGVFEGQFSEDAEIRERAESIYAAYFNVCSSDKEIFIPKIWDLPESVRYPDGLGKMKKAKEYSICKPIKTKDVAKEYYEKARKQYTERYRSWTHDVIEKHATNMYIRDCLIVGEKPESVKRKLDLMVKLGKENEHYIQSSNIKSPFDCSEDYPPGPMIKKEDHKYPSHFYSMFLMLVLFVP